MKDYCLLCELHLVSGVKVHLLNLSIEFNYKVNLRWKCLFISMLSLFNNLNQFLI